MISLKKLSLAVLFASLSLTIRTANLLVIPLPIPPLKLDFRGVLAYIGSMLVGPEYAWIIGVGAGKLFMGTDWVGWIPAMTACALTFKKLKRKLEVKIAVSVAIGMLIGYSCYLPVYTIVYGVPPQGISFLLALLAFRATLNYAATIPLSIVFFKALKRYSPQEYSFYTS
mgnify:CR=1 FL=1